MTLNIAPVLEEKLQELYNQKVIKNNQEGWYRDLSSTTMIGIVATAQVLICLKSGEFDASQLRKSTSTLASFARHDGSFPFISNVNTTGVVDATAWACLALITCKTYLDSYETVVKGALDWLLEAQNPDGGWGIIKNSPSRVVSTTIAVRVMIAIQSTDNDISDSISKGLKYISANQLPSGAWGDVAGRECLGATAYSLILMSETNQKQSNVTTKAVNFVISRLDHKLLWDNCLNREDVQIVEAEQHKRLNFIYPLSHLFIRGILACGFLKNLPPPAIEEYLNRVRTGKPFAGDRTDNEKETSYGQHDLTMSLLELSKCNYVPPAGLKYLGYDAINKNDYPRIYQVGGDESASTDIIFIHGLTGDAKATWLNLNTKFYLPREIVENTNIRSFVVGYSNPASRFLGKGMSLDERTKNLSLLLRNNSIFQRRTILVGHSFGGLLIKKLMLSMKLSGSTEEFSNLKGVIFLATPHFGSRWANFIYLIQGFIVGTQAVKNLFYKNKELMILGQDYAELVSSSSINIKLRSFGENSNFMVVNSRSSNPNISFCEHTPVDASHSEICKPKDSSDLVFTSMYKFIKALTNA